MLKVSFYILSATLVLQQSASTQPSSLGDVRSNSTIFIEKVLHEGNIRKRHAADIAVDLFRPIHAETEKPLNLAKVPTTNARGNPKVVFNHMTFDEQSAASGKFISNEDDNEKIDQSDLDDNNQNQQKNNFRNFEYKIDESNRNASLPQDFQEALRGVSLPGSSGKNFLDFIQDTIKKQEGNGDITVRLSEDKNVKYVNKTTPVGANSSGESIDTDSFFHNFRNFNDFLPFSFNSKATDLSSSNTANLGDKFSQFFNFTSPFTTEKSDELAKEQEISKAIASHPTISQTTQGTNLQPSVLSKRPSNSRTRFKNDYSDYENESDDLEPSTASSIRRPYKIRRKPLPVHFDSHEYEDENAYVGATRHRVQPLAVRRRPSQRRVYHDYEEDSDYEEVSLPRAGTRRRSFNGYKRKTRPVTRDDDSDEDSYEYVRRRPLKRKQPTSLSSNYRSHPHLKKLKEALRSDEVPGEEVSEKLTLAPRPEELLKAIPDGIFDVLF